MRAQQSDCNNNNNDDELILFDNVLVPNIDNELVFGLGDDSYVHSLDWDGANIAFTDTNADPDHEELQNLLLDLDDDLPAPTFSSNVDMPDDGDSLCLESFGYGNTAPTTSKVEAIPKIVGSSRAGAEMTDFKNSLSTFQTNDTTDTTDTTDTAIQNTQAVPKKNETATSCSCESQQNVVCTDHARKARRQRMEIILRRRGLQGKSTMTRSRRVQNNAVAEHAVKALLSSNSAPVAMEDVQSIANQLLMDMSLMAAQTSSTITMPRSVSFADGLELVARPPSPVFSASVVKPSAGKTRISTRRIRGEFPVPDPAISSFTPRSSSVPPRKKAQSPLNSSTSRSRKKTPASDCAVDPTMLPDGDDPESRRQRRLIRNRMSAQLHRERKREAMDALQRMIQEKDVQIQSLEQELGHVHKKNTSLEEALSTIRQHFGTVVVENLIRPGCNVNTPPDSPPHLVNTSDLSSCASDEDESSISSPSSPPSPSTQSCPVMPYNTMKDNRKRSSAISTSTVSCEQPKSNKKKKLLNAVMMAPLCICAFIGCLAVVPFQNTEVPSVTVSNVVKQQPTYRQKISSHHAHSDNSDIRRRLLSVKSSTGDSLLDLVLGDSSKSQLQDWIISPIENFPARWKVDHALKYPTPWSYSSQELLFDFRSLSLSNSVRTYDFVTKNQQLNEDDSIQEEHKIREKVKSPNSRLRGSSSNISNSSSSDEGKIDEPLLNNIKASAPIVPPSNAIAISKSFVNSNSHSSKSSSDSGASVTNSGSNYLFCPSAQAKFTPEFLKLSKFRRDVVVTDEDIDDAEDSSPAEEVDADNGPQVMMDSYASGKLNNEANVNSKALVPANSYSHKRILGKNDKFIYKAVLEGNDPYMSILLPASAVSGGTVSPRSDEPWIELGCQVLSAKIVNGVDFV